MIHRCFSLTGIESLNELFCTSQEQKHSTVTNIKSFTEFCVMPIIIFSLYLAKLTNDRNVDLTFYLAMTLGEGPYILLLTTQQFCLRSPRYGFNSSNIRTLKYRG